MQKKAMRTQLVLYPKQIKQLLELAESDHDGNNSSAVRQSISERHQRRFPEQYEAGQ